MAISPVALMTIGTAVSVGSTIFGAIGQMNQAAYQSAVAARNAQIAEANAREEVQRSQVEQQDWGEDARGQLGTLVASLAASGASLEGGTPALRRSGTERLIARDSTRIREEGEITANRYRQQKADFQAESGMAKRRRKFALTSGLLDAGSTYLSGASRIASARSSLIS